MRRAALLLLVACAHRTRLYATGRYRDVTVTVDAIDQDGLHRVLVELDPQLLDSQLHEAR